MTKNPVKLCEIDNIKFADLAVLRREKTRFCVYNKIVR